MRTDAPVHAEVRGMQLQFSATYSFVLATAASRASALSSPRVNWSMDPPVASPRSTGARSTSAPRSTR